MKILFISNNYTPYSGGVVSSINVTISHLHQMGHKVKLVTLDFLGEHQDASHVYRIPSISRFTYNTLHAAIPYRPTAYLERLIEAYKPDIIHVHHPFLLGVIGNKLGKQRGIPVLFTYHTQYERFPVYLPLPTFLTSRIITARVARFCKDVDGIIAVGPVVTSFLQKHGVQTPSIELASGLQGHFLRPFVEKQPNKPFRLLLVSRFSQEKNIHFLIDMFAGLPPESFTLTLVGFGPLFEPMQRYVYEKGIADRVTFIHKPSKDRLVDCYHQSDLFIFSSQTETQGIVLSEAFSAGLPIVSLPGPGPDECIVNGKNGYIVHSAEEMRQAIIMIAHDSEQYHRLRLQAWQSAQRFHPAKQVAPLVDFYKKIITLSKQKQGKSS